MNKNTLFNQKQTELLIETIGKNAWFDSNPNVHVVVWSNVQPSMDVLRNYLCKDGSGYIRGYYDGAGTFYVKRFHLRDEVWTDAQSFQS
jgi:hypothetical protein